MNVKERLLKFIESKNITPYRFEKECGLSRNYVNNLVSGKIGIVQMEKILTRYPMLNSRWLVNGEGEMQTENREEDTAAQSQQPLVKIPMIPLYARAGGFDDFTQAARREDCEMVISPLKNADFAIRVNGDSMEPEYPNGSVVLIKKIDEDRFIDFSRVYVLNTINGIVIKRLMPGTTEDNLTCVSMNKEYPNFLVNKSDIFGVYVVCMVMTMK